MGDPRAARLMGQARSRWLARCPVCARQVMVDDGSMLMHYTDGTVAKSGSRDEMSFCGGSGSIPPKRKKPRASPEDE